jgi:hypothetical protein
MARNFARVVLPHERLSPGARWQVQSWKNPPWSLPSPTETRLAPACSTAVIISSSISSGPGRIPAKARATASGVSSVVAASLVPTTRASRLQRRGRAFGRRDGGML